MLLYSYPLLLQEARTVLGLQLPLVILSSRAIFATILPWIEPEEGTCDDSRGLNNRLYFSQFFL